MPGENEEKKYLRNSLYIGDEERVRREKRVRLVLGVVTASELYRRWIDQEADRLGVFEDCDAAQRSLPLGRVG